MNKIQSTSNMLFHFFRALCWLIPLTMTYLILFNLQGTINWGFWTSFVTTTEMPDASHFSLMHRLVILAVQLIPESITVLICYQLAKLFQLYTDGILFAEENIKRIRAIGTYMIAGQLINLIYQALISITLTYNNPVGQHLLTLSFGTTNLSTLVTGLIIIIASWIIKEAHQIKSDSQLTI